MQFYATKNFGYRFKKKIDLDKSYLLYICGDIFIHFNIHFSTHLYTILCTTSHFLCTHFLKLFKTTFKKNITAS